MNMCSFEVVVVRWCADESVGGVVCEYVCLKVFSPVAVAAAHICAPAEATQSVAGGEVWGGGFRGVGGCFSLPAPSHILVSQQEREPGSAPDPPHPPPPPDSFARVCVRL